MASGLEGMFAKTQAREVHVCRGIWSTSHTPCPTPTALKAMCRSAVVLESSYCVHGTMKKVGISVISLPECSRSESLSPYSAFLCRVALCGQIQLEESVTHFGKDTDYRFLKFLVLSFFLQVAMESRLPLPMTSSSWPKPTPAGLLRTCCAWRKMCSSGTWSFWGPSGASASLS